MVRRVDAGVWELAVGGDPAAGAGCWGRVSETEPEDPMLSIFWETSFSFSRMSKLAGSKLAVRQRRTFGSFGQPETISGG